MTGAWQQRCAPVAAQLVAADALVFVTPEWGGMVPAALKNLSLLCTGVRGGRDGPWLPPAPGCVMVGDVNPPARKSRSGLLALLALLVALVGAYLGNCFQGLGLGAGTGAGVKQDVKEGAAIAKEIVGESADVAARARVIVEGERCRLGDEKTPRSCDAVCKDLGGGAVEVAATTGAQRTVDALRTCLQGRGVKVTVIAD